VVNKQKNTCIPFSEFVFCYLPAGWSEGKKSISPRFEAEANSACCCLRSKFKLVFETTSSQGMRKDIVSNDPHKPFARDPALLDTESMMLMESLTLFQMSS
jgi:hypothetical protein